MRISCLRTPSFIKNSHAVTPSPQTGSSQRQGTGVVRSRTLGIPEGGSSGILGSIPEPTSPHSLGRKFCATTISVSSFGFQFAFNSRLKAGCTLALLWREERATCCRGFLHNPPDLSAPRAEESKSPPLVLGPTRGLGRDRDPRTDGPDPGPVCDPWRQAGRLPGAQPSAPLGLEGRRTGCLAESREVLSGSVLPGSAGSGPRSQSAEGSQGELSASWAQVPTLPRWGFGTLRGAGARRRKTLAIQFSECQGARCNVASRPLL